MLMSTISKSELNLYIWFGARSLVTTSFNIFLPSNLWGCFQYPCTIIQNLQHYFHVSYIKFDMLHYLGNLIKSISYIIYLSNNWWRTLDWPRQGSASCFCRKATFLLTYSITMSFTYGIDLKVSGVLKSLNSQTSNNIRCA
jgi:hypothetical protein